MYKAVKMGSREVAQAMLRAGKSVEEVAGALGMSRSTLYRIKNNAGPDGGGAEGIEAEIRRGLAGKYLRLAEEIFASILEEDIIDAPLKDRAAVAMMCTDKAVALIRDGYGWLEVEVAEDRDTANLALAQDSSRAAVGSSAAGTAEDVSGCAKLGTEDKENIAG